MAKTGRPPIPIDEQQVENLAKIGCTYSEIGAVVGCSKATLNSRFRTIISKGHEELKMSIRRMQLQAANKGNIVMMIWLGKQYLGQQDKQHVEMKGETRIVERIVPVRHANGNGNGHANGNGNGTARGAGRLPG
jgi:hypothetical protein